jgi:hypothetical protein
LSLLFLGCGHVLGRLDDGANNSLLFLFLILATIGGAKISAALIVVFVLFFSFSFPLLFPADDAAELGKLESLFPWLRYHIIALAKKTLQRRCRFVFRAEDC